MADLLENQEEFDSDEDDDDYVPEGGDESEDNSDALVDEDGNIDLASSKRKKPLKLKPVSKKKRTRKDNQASLIEESEDERNKVDQTVNEQEKSDSLWADFMSDVAPLPKLTKRSVQSSGQPTCINNAEEKPKKILKKEIYHFAGEAVEVTKEVESSSQTEGYILKSPICNNKTPNSSSKKSGGIGNVLGLLSSKKNKLSTLEKSKLDWNKFKEEEGIAEELKLHNKGKSGYLEKQDFFQRTDLRQFEVEKKLRMGCKTNRS